VLLNSKRVLRIEGIKALLVIKIRCVGEGAEIVPERNVLGAFCIELRESLAIS
jgi:hypothetical protein